MWRKSAQPKLSSQDSSAPPAVSSSAAVELSPAAGAQAVALTHEPVSTKLRPGTSEIACHLKIDGEIFGDADLYIDGEVHGKIRIAGGRVTVGPRGLIRADIEAREIAIDGRVEGGLQAAESVHIGASGHVQGRVVAPRIRIDDGAFLRGSVETVAAVSAAAPVAGVHEAKGDSLRAVPVGAKEEQSAA